MNIKYNLSEERKEEMKELYDGTWKSVRNIATTYNVSLSRARWLVNHNNIHERLNKWVLNWRKENPEKARIINSRAMKRYNSTPRGKELNKTRMKKYYKKNRKKLIECSKKRYRENKLINK